MRMRRPAGLVKTWPLDALSGQCVRAAEGNACNVLPVLTSAGVARKKVLITHVQSSRPPTAVLNPFSHDGRHAFQHHELVVFEHI